MGPIIIVKSAGEQLRIEVRAYKGHAVVSIRVYSQADASTWQPTRQGITVSLDLWGNFEGVIVALAVDEAGPKLAAHGDD